MTKTFTRLQLFSIVDGRLSTKIDDVYDMLNHICDTNLMTHQLPTAFDYFKEKEPHWYVVERAHLVDLKKELGSDNFQKLIENIHEHNVSVEVHQLKDEMDTSDFEKYMVENDLLLKKQL